MLLRRILGALRDRRAALKLPFSSASGVKNYRPSHFTCKKSIKPDRVSVLAPSGARGAPVAQVRASDCADDFVTFEPGETYSRSRPELFNLADWQRDELLDQLKAGPVLAPPAEIATFRNASVLHCGTIMTAEGLVVEESLRNTQELSSFHPFKRGPDGRLRIDMPKRTTQARLRGAHVVLRQECDSNYGHWLVECLPQAYLAIRELGLAGFKFIVSSYDAKIDQVYRETLACLGVHDSQIVAMGWEPIHVDELIFPMPPAKHQYVKSPMTIRMLEGFVAQVGSSGAPERVYVSRNAYHKRRLLNEDEIVSICHRHGFSVVYPEQLSFEEQIRVFSAAKTVVGSCGAALTNIAFAPRGGTLISLANKVMPDGFFWDLSDLKNFRYVSIHGQSVGGADRDPADYGPGHAEFFQQMDEDFEIDPRLFEEVLGRALEREHADRLANQPCPL